MLAWHAAPVLAINDLHLESSSEASPEYFTNATLLVFGRRSDVSKLITISSLSAS